MNTSKKEPPDGRARSRLRFGLRSLIALPVMVAILIVAVDRWTAAPWSNLSTGYPVIFKVQDGSTRRPIVGARFRLFRNGMVEIDMLTGAEGQISQHGGPVRDVGYQSLVRDARRVDLGDASLVVTAADYEDFTAEASQKPLICSLGPEGKSFDYVIRLKQRKR